ncbi:d-lactate dehydrogenase (cytochrome) [Fusarium napiforme]|uniref:D-lactate dehydrogenase (cytochrome) n=1 Tax=Fusarium napiforme TaxID=42672 RepID=A0A8H5J468_9HYPO|nr:d-lactate dehydrogenase (cytochrome) [Fusarium napiforme]
MDERSPSQRTRRTPNHACRKSGHHEQCALIQSKRRRGPDGRYTLLPDIESRRSSGSPGFAPSNQDESTALSTEDSPTEREHNSTSMQQPGDTTVTRPASDQHASPNTQPSVVGESWYASYVMRGYTPGHNSVHRPIGECNETVQSVTRDTRRESVCSRPPLPQGKTTLSDLPSPDLVDRLIKAYFDRFHAFCPILGREYFLSSLKDGSMSGTLLRSVLFVASLHCDPEVLHLMGYSTRWDANNALYNRASTAFDADRESSRTHMILSSYLLHYWFGSPTAYRDCHWWLAAAIRSAQCTGYHRSTRNSRMSPEERSRWKRIWWCLYIAISTGTPMVINDEDHDVEELVEEDFPNEALERVQYIISQVKLSKAMARLYFSHCSPSRLSLCKEAHVLHEAMGDIQATLQAWYDSCQGLNFSNGHHHLSLTLKVYYHYYLINLSQRLQRQCTAYKEVKPVTDAAAQIFNLVENSLLFWTPEHFPMIYVSALFSAMMALAAEVKTSAPKSDQIFVKIRPGLLALKQFESVYILARWIKNFFMDILNRPAPFDAVETQRPPPNLHVDDTAVEGTASETMNGTDGIPTTTTSVGQVAYDATGYEDSGFGFDQSSGFEGGGFWPTYLANGVFSGVQSSDDMEFPHPDSFQYQAILTKDGYYVSGYDQRLLGLDYQLSHFAQLRTYQNHHPQDHCNGRQVAEVRPYVLGLAALTVGMAGALSVSSQPTKRHLASTQSLLDTAEVQHDLSVSNIQGACTEFAAILGPENVSTERTDLVTHSGSDYQSYAWTEDSAILSQVILYPETTEQVSEVMKVCFRRRLPVTPYSGGTSIEGQYIPHLQGICVDFGRMNNIVELNKYDLDCVVQPGIGWMDLNEELAVHGLFFPPDPGPGAMIGGMVGTGCSGTNAAAYGTMKDWVLSLTVVLADGTVIKTRQRARKSSAGYDLTRTFIGSEGTLGLVTEATLKLAVKPPCEAVAVCTFPTLRDAASAVREVLSNGIQVAAVEILDEVQMKSINDSALTRLKWQEEPTLFFKFTGSDEFIVDHLAKQVGSITKQNRSTTYTFASDEAERNELWSARKNALWSMLAMRKLATDKVWTTDVAVPLSRLPDIIEFAKADIERSGLLGSIVGHVGDGNFHTLLLFPEEKRHIAEDVVHRMVDKAIEMKGTATGEHGVGLVKRDYLEKELGKEAVDAMRSMKNAFDPLCILNCDKVIRMQAA